MCVCPGLCHKEHCCCWTMGNALLGSEQGCRAGLVVGGQRFPSPSQAGPGRCYPMWGNGSLADLTEKIWGLLEGYNSKSDLWRTILT